jgi:serine kinase of HPr protein (carbohydrate metabolism regulator)
MSHLTSKKEIFLSIGGYCIAIIFTPSDRPMDAQRLQKELVIYYKDFTFNKKPSKIDYTINISFNENLLYSKNKRQEAYLPLYRENSLKKLTTYYYINQEEFNMVLMHVISNLLYRNADGLLLHSSAVETPTSLLVFCGQKRAGKSTISHLLSPPFRRVADDNIIIKKIANGFAIFQCPFNERYPVEMKGAAMISKIPQFFFLEKAERFEVKPINTINHLSTIYSLTNLPKLNKYSQSLRIKKNINTTFLSFLAWSNWHALSFAKDSKKVIELFENFL